MAISRISKISLHNWKNFKDVECVLGNRTFLIGSNASGKSNFLDVFLFLKEVAENGLKEAVTARNGVSALRCLSARQYSEIGIELELADESGKAQWQYRLIFSQDNASRPIVKTEQVKDLVSGKVILNRPDKDDSTDPLRLTQTALEQIVANKGFREIAAFFSTVSYQHLLPQVVRDPKGFTPTPVTDDPYGRDFLLRLWKTSERTRNSRLDKITKALQVAVPQLVELRPEMDNQGIPHLVGRYKHWRPHGAKQYESQFSDGTIRLLGLMWSVFEGNGPLLLEEPELSLHSEVVRQLPTLFERINKYRKQRRQIVLSTHSEMLLSDTGIGPNEVLWLEPSENGTLIHSPDRHDRELWASGLTAAEILLPKSGPSNPEQLGLAI